MIDEFGKLAWKFLSGRKCARRKDPSPGHVSQGIYFVRLIRTAKQAKLLQMGCASFPRQQMKYIALA